MHNFFLLLNRYRSFLLFLFLEIISLWMLFTKNPYQSGKFFNFFTEISGRVHEFSSSVSYYLNLKNVNDSLMNENSRLMISHFSDDKHDSISFPFLKHAVNENQYDIYTALVVNNTVYQPENFITLNKGIKNGIKPGMGVITQNAVIGIISRVSENYSVAVSLLNTKSLFSVKIKKNNTAGTLTWDGIDPSHAILKYIPKHIVITLGDSVVSSDYSSKFPANIPIGKIEEKKLNPGENFFTLKIKLHADFSKIRYVYIMQNKTSEEQQAL